MLFFNITKEALVSPARTFACGGEHVVRVALIAVSAAWMVVQHEHIVKLVESFAMVGREALSWPALGSVFV